MKSIFILHKLFKSPLLLLALITSCSSFEKDKSSYTGLDCHVHVHPRGEGLYKSDRAKFTLSSAGLSHGCILSQGYQGPYGEEKKNYKTLKQFVVSRNDWTLEEAKKHKGLLPFCSVPVKAKWANSEVKRCIDNNSVGLKLHLVSEKASLLNKSNRQNLENVFLAASDKLIILIHINHNDRREVKVFFDIVKKYPQVKIIVAHNLGRNFAMLKNAPKNLYTEVSSLVMWPEDLGKRFVNVWREFGIEKVLLGSDWPVFHPAGHLYLLNKYPLTDKERRMIVRDNAQVLFKEHLVID